MTDPPSPTPIDAASIRAHWRDKAAHWTGWAETTAAMADRFNRPLLDAVGLRPGERLLDLAAGAGEPALTAAEIAGPAGRVVATDLIPEMLAGIKQRDPARRLTLVAADMQRLPFADAAFERISCRFGLMFVPDPLAALKEARRALRPGGRAGFLTWGPRADQTLFTALGEAVAEVIGVPEDDHHWQVFRLDDPQALTALMRDAGFREVETRSLSFEGRAPADRPFWRPQLAMSFGHLLEDGDEAAHAAIDAAMRRALAPQLAEDGTRYRLQAHALLAAGAA